MKLDVVKLTRQLVAYPSESQTSNVEVTEFIADILAQMDFEIERLPYVDKNGVDKISIVARLGKGSGGLSLMSHDDDTRKEILGAAGRPDDGTILDAVNLNNLDDWTELHNAVTG